MEKSNMFQTTNQFNMLFLHFANSSLTFLKLFTNIHHVFPQTHSPWLILHVSPI